MANQKPNPPASGPNPKITPNAPTTQEHLNIAAIRDSIVILKNGEFRSIILVSAINFALKSTQEQNALIFQYQNFLNSLHFPIEIVIQSRQLDLSPYLEALQEKSQNMENELLKLQIADYIDFVKRLIEIARVMDKNFFVVVPLAPPTYQKEGFLSRLIGTRTQLRITNQEFQKYKEELLERVNIIISGLSSLSLSAASLNTQQIIELFYNIYNPEEATKERLLPPELLKASVIQKAPEEEKNG